MLSGKSDNSRTEPSIFVVEDNEVVGEYIRTSLKMAGYNDIQLFTNPRDAVKVIKESQASLVITDIYMPGLNGFAITRWLQRLTGNQNSIPAIVVTADQSDETRQKLNQNGVGTILKKPLEASELIQAVQDVLGQTSNLATNELTESN